MSYEEYFDSLIEKDLYVEKNEIFRILINKHEDSGVQGYNGLGEMVFEFLLALYDKDDFASIIQLKEILGKNYKEVYDEEYGQFADILIPYYISIHQDEKAKSSFDEWIEKDYDYDSILILINRLAHYGKESWIDEYIAKEYNAIKESPKLISGAEEDLIVYKIMLEIGKFNRDAKKMNEVIEELAKYELELNESHMQILENKYVALNFGKERRNYVFIIINEFQIFLNEKYDIPYVQSAIIMKTLTDYYENSKYNDLSTYFKIRENSFERYMSENSVNGMNHNVESNFAMLYFLPVFYQFLGEKKIFGDEDIRKENKKISML